MDENNFQQVEFLDDMNPFMFRFKKDDKTLRFEAPDEEGMMLGFALLEQTFEGIDAEKLVERYGELTKKLWESEFELAFDEMDEEDMDDDEEVEITVEEE